MLKPSYLEKLPDRLIELYAEVEAAIIAVMAGRISKMDFIPSAEWQYYKLTEMGYIHDEILRSLSDVSGIRKAELERLMNDAGIKALEADNKIYRKVGLTPPELNASLSLQTVLQAGFENTNGLFDNLTRTTANTATKQFENVLDRAWLEITSGAFDYNTSVRNAIKSLSDKGIATITYPSGHTDYLDVAVRRAVVTGVNQTSLKMQDTLADEMETDLVDVTAHAGARNTGTGPENHAEWQGKRYSRSGKSEKYPSLVEVTGYGTGEGLGGWNCRHNMFPAFEGMEPVYTQEELDEMNAPKYVYNGKEITEYEATQKQRYIERRIRKYKREFKAMESAGFSTDEASSKISKWQNIQKDFLDQTGLKRQYDRENIIGFGKSEAAGAKKGADEYYKYWSKSIGVNESIKTLDQYYDMKYNNPPEYNLLQRYARGVKAGLISPDASFNNYSDLFHRIQSEIVGKTTSSGIVITGQSEHFMQRVLGTMSDPATGLPRSGVAIEDIQEALFVRNEVGTPVTRSDGQKSVKFIGSRCAVSMNPDSGVLIQTNPRKER